MKNDRKVGSWKMLSSWPPRLTIRVSLGMLAALLTMIRLALPLLAVCFLWIPGLRAEESALEKLVKEERKTVDNEAVSVYGGKVGKLDAIFFIEWSGKKNPIEGFYYYPSRGKEKRYKLKGTNPKDGVIHLEEYSRMENGILRLSGTCRMTKKVTKSHIVWEGKLNNTDGRKLAMSFSRKR